MKDEQKALFTDEILTEAAARYALDRENSLRVFLEYPAVPIDTNHL